jgi:hypothetical protein
MRLKSQALALILATIVITSAHADLDHIDPVALKVAQFTANELFMKRDVIGLRALLKESHLFVKQDVALKLGRLGAKEAIEELRQLDRTYANFACAESGQFGVAVVLIENPDKARQQAALLELAKEVSEPPKHAASVIDQAGRELARFDGVEIEEKLASINTYGAQFTVLALQCRKLSPTDAIANCIKVLELHETPQKAEAAQALLISSGKPASAQVQKLKASVESKIKTSDPIFTISKTIAGRCEQILKTISEGEQDAASNGG